LTGLGIQDAVTVPGRSGGLFVLVAGWPGSGKSTLAAALAPRLGLPLLAKDEIKEALMDALGDPRTVADSQRLGQAAVLAMLRVARTCPGAVMDSTWFDYALPLARVLPGQGEPSPSPGLGPVVEVDTSAEADLDQLIARLDQVRRD
jgi:hypothetical protein